MNQRIVVIVVALAALIAGCASSRDVAGSRSLSALNAVNAPEPPTPTVPNRVPAWPCKNSDPTPSLRPLGPLPAPGAMPPGSFMARILRRGYLIAGVDQNTAGFGYRAANGNINGFDIDLLREVSRAIFGDARPIVFRSVSSAERIPAVANGDVDIVASLLSITCTPRWQQVDFTTEYYRAHQGVLVRSDSNIRSAADLNGKKVCAIAGTTSIVNKESARAAPHASIYPVKLRTDCLVALQEGLVDAITSDDTVLYGFKSQDPLNTKLLPDQLEAERYGMAINIDHPEFVRFVNGVLEQLRNNGRWSQLVNDDLVRAIGIPSPTMPQPEYRA